MMILLEAVDNNTEEPSSIRWERHASNMMAGLSTHSVGAKRTSREHWRLQFATEDRTNCARQAPRRIQSIIRDIIDSL